jgi:hypothetical protein
MFGCKISQMNMKVSEVSVYTFNGRSFNPLDGIFEFKPINIDKYSAYEALIV